MTAGEKLAVLYGLLLGPLVMAAGAANHFLGAIHILNEDFTRGLFILACAGLIIGSMAQLFQAMLSEHRFTFLMALVLLLDMATGGLVFWYFLFWKNL